MSAAKRSGRGSAPTAAEARAEAQARAKAGRGARDAALAAHFSGGVPGEGILRFGNVTTALFVVTSVVATIANTRPTRVAAAFVDVVLFVIGCVVFFVALYGGAVRSREAEMSMSGWWFLSGSAPGKVRATLLGGLAVQVAVALATASIRFQSLLAFGILVPTLGIAMCGLWGARYGFFPPRRTV